MTMQTLFTTFTKLLPFALVATLLVVVAACDSDEIPTTVDPVDRTAAELVEESDFLSTLETAIGEADPAILNALGGEGPFTVFAPGNPAFGNWDVEGLLANPELLADVLRYHVVEGSFTTGDLGDGQTLTALQGTELTAASNNVNGISFFRVNQNVTNGVVHITNGLLFENRTIAERAWYFLPAEEFYDAIVAFGVREALNDPEDDLTAFIPTNASFAAVEALIEAQGLSDEDVAEILQYHVIDDAISAGELVGLLDEGPVAVPTLQGEDIIFEGSFDEDGGIESITINDGQATINLGDTDLRSSNGIAHFITGVLLPEEFRPAMDEVIASTGGLGTLTAALGATGLDETLANRDGTFTVFAPSDDAFSAYDVDLLLADEAVLADVLQYHVAGEVLGSGDLAEGPVTTLQGDDINVSFGEEDAVFINNASVTAVDIPAVNGVLHIIDDVLLENRTLATRLNVTLATQTLKERLREAELAGAFEDETLTWTVFAPTNDAFDAANFNQFTFSERESILQYHVLTEAVDSGVLVDALTDEEAELSVETLQGEEMTFTGTFDDDGNLTGININGDQASIDLGNVDIEALDSFIHLIDGVLLPPSFTDENGDNGDNGDV